MDYSKKYRPIYVLQILYNHSDDDHPIKISEIQTFLKDEYGLDKIERQTIKKDIDNLIAAGIDIDFYKSSQNQYRFIDRNLDIAELKVVIDAVAAAKFIPKSKSDTLIEKLSKYGGPFAGNALKRGVKVEDRIKHGSGKVFRTVDSIHNAINHKRKIAFKYFTYDDEKGRVLRNNGEEYIFSPYKLVWNGDYYYIVGYSDKHGDIVSFRVDRIDDVPRVLEDEKAVAKPSDFDINEYVSTMFRMFDDERKTVELLCYDGTMNAIVDQFGEKLLPYDTDGDTFKIKVITATSHIFFSWIFGFDGKVEILSPDDVRKEYADMIKRAAEKIIT